MNSSTAIPASARGAVAANLTAAAVPVHDAPRALLQLPRVPRKGCTALSFPSTTRNGELQRQRQAPGSVRIDLYANDDGGPRGPRGPRMEAQGAPHFGLIQVVGAGDPTGGPGEARLLITLY